MEAVVWALMEYFLLYSKIITFVWRLTGLAGSTCWTKRLSFAATWWWKKPLQIPPANTLLQTHPYNYIPACILLYLVKGNAVSTKRLKSQEQNQINLFFQCLERIKAIALSWANLKWDSLIFNFLQITSCLDGFMIFQRKMFYRRRTFLYRREK